MDSVVFTELMPVPLPGSTPPAREHSDSPQQEPTTMKTGDTYQPVPGEDKNPDLDFADTSSRSKESIVRHSIHVKQVLYSQNCLSDKIPSHHWIGVT